MVYLAFTCSSIFHILSGYCKNSQGDTQIVEMCGFGCTDFIYFRNFLDMFYPKNLGNVPKTHTTVADLCFHTSKLENVTGVVVHSVANRWQSFFAMVE